MEKNKEYEIKTIEDIADLVTSENVENFLEDFMDVILKLVHIKEIIKKENGGYPLGLMKEFTWTDDDVRGVTSFTFKVKDDGKSKE